MGAGAMTEEKNYTVREVADILRVTPRTVWRMISSGELQAFKVRGDYRVRRQVLEDLMQGKAPKQEED